MNFIEAHKMVHDFADVVGKGGENSEDFFLSIESLPFLFDKDKLVSAFQIFIYHMIFFQTRTPEEYEKYYVLYQANIDRFIPRSEVLKARQYAKIIGNKSSIYKSFNKGKIKLANELYGQFMQQHQFWINPYRIDDIFDANIEEMHEYRNELYKRVKAACDEEIYEVYDEITELYAKRTYEKANVEYISDYFMYFQKFESMRNALNEGVYGDYYLKYKDYIFSNR